ncbi:hypothetical protein [Actinoplanes friuliensis]|jgi:hypothetical protein|uniref:Uncharacterized protein n=1 Tax=Actinoplanes friuliensis DSM 7358 TaxID=1246995 RepID=U5W1J8_9ACTN|nr:hypothetical protein [Actinoplanes friuliensis]AGZ43024.1 hypothetical protein AFR_23780 [Actinoplanes friuliensis DSM 7358]
MQPRPPRLFEADDVLSGRISLDGYPFRLIYLVISAASFYAGTSIHPGDLGRVDVLLSAAELLETRGWQTVSVDAGGKLLCLRRVG